MIRYSLRRLVELREAILSRRNGPLEQAYRELEELRDRVRKAEMAAAKSRGEPPLQS